MTTTIIALGFLYFIGHVLTHFFDRAKVPDVLILILFGMLIGPILNIISAEDIGHAGSLLTSIALIIILFEGGLNIELASILKSAKQAIKLTVAYFFITAAIVYCILHHGFGYSGVASLVTGFICGGTSSAVVIPMVGAMKVGKEATTILILESALTDVLCIVFTLGVLQSIDSGEFEWGKIVSSLISSLVLASVIGAVAGVFWLSLLNKIRQYPNTQFATFAFMFIVYGIAESLEFSGAIAALAFGILLGNNGLVGNSISKFVGNIKVGIVTDAEKNLYREIVFLLKIFFFIYLGISIPIEHIHIVLIALSVVVAVYTVRPLATKFLVTRNVDAYDRTIISVMVPKGLAAAVLAGLPSQYGLVEGGDIQAITYYIVLLSIVTTSVLIPLIEKTPFGTLMKKSLYIKQKSSPTDAQPDTQK